MLRRLASTSLPALFVTALATPVQAQIDPELLAGMSARSIGPAGMSGRIAVVTAVETNPDIIYVGAATGGVWKSTNGGLNFEPLFDDQPVAAIGAIAINQSSPDIVWVGTGEGNTRNSVSVGNGVYRSLDGGRSWTHLGLEGAERIHRILLHPDDPDVAYVAAMGALWGENPERGVYKTVDGGATWQKVLYVDERTGVADLVMDPRNPNKLFAAMWEYRRWPWFFRSGGPGSGLYVTVDGGKNWKELTPEDGLPEGDLGRMGLGIAASDPDIVYAYVEAEDHNAIYRSNDGGFSWRKTDSEGPVGNRPFYYADIRVDPQDPNRVYSLWSRLSVSIDGGESFEMLGSFRDAPHPDHHAMWINPNEPTHIIEGNDGGVYMSRDRGETWRFVSNLPLAQYYHINVDMDQPYHVLGGMQDNGSWRGPAYVLENGGIRNHHWEEVGFGDGFAVLAVPEDPTVGYSMSQEGNLMRWDVKTGERKSIRPVHPEGVELRFNWNAAIAIDPFDPNTVYYGSQFVHRSTDRGDSWEIISPDLTTDNPEWQRQGESGGLTLDVTGAENFTTIITIAPSPLERGVIWVGTDDGRVHVTRDGGGRWTSLEDRIRDVPENTWVPHIEPSRFDPAEAFVVFDNHRRSDWTPYVYVTGDYGRSWRSLATDDLRGYALAVEQDPVKRDLLFLGTEFGLWFTLDGGRQWHKWTHGFPTVAARALVIHPREHDLVVGTHGRAAYIIDDIRPLRSVEPQLLAAPLHLFEIPDAIQYNIGQTGASRFPGSGEFRGENREYGAVITFSLSDEKLPHPNEEIERQRKAAERQHQAEAAEEEEAEEEASGPTARGRDRGPQVEVEISDADGEVVNSFERPVKLGVNRIAWNLRHDGFERPQAGREEGGGGFFFGGGFGPAVVPGIYTVTLKYGEHEASGTVNVLQDPRFNLTLAQRQAKLDALMHAGAVQEVLAEAVSRLRDTRDEIDKVLGMVSEPPETEATDGEEGQTEVAEAPSARGQAVRAGGANRELMREARNLKRKLTELEERLWEPPSQGKSEITADTTIYSRVRSAYFSMSSSWDEPTEAQTWLLEHAETRLQEALDEINRTFAEDVAAFRESVMAAGLTFLEAEDPLELPVR